MSNRNYLTTAEVADILGVSQMRVRQLKDVLKAETAGNFLLFRRSEVQKFGAVERKPGRPKKNKN